MQCACPICGIMMAQVPKGLESCCKCANCHHECRDCLGREGLKVRTREELASLDETFRRRDDEDEGGYGEM